MPLSNWLVSSVRVNHFSHVAIVNCMQELKPEIKSLANRNNREIQMSTNAVKQLVSFERACQSFFSKPIVN